MQTLGLGCLMHVVMELARVGRSVRELEHTDSIIAVHELERPQEHAAALALHV